MCLRWEGRESRVFIEKTVGEQKGCSLFRGYEAGEEGNVCRSETRQRVQGRRNVARM